MSSHGSNGEQVRELAARLKAEAEAAHRTRQDQAEREQVLEDAALRMVRAEVSSLASEGGREVRYYIDNEANEKGLLKAVRVSISSAPAWLRRPFAICHISASAGEEGQKARIHVFLEVPEVGSGLYDTLRKSMMASDDGSEPEPLQQLRVLGAEFINRRESFEFATPIWYREVGSLIGWPLAALTWLLLGLSGGLAGALLGWIPAWIVFALSRAFWLPTVVLCGWLAARYS